MNLSRTLLAGLSGLLFVLSPLSGGVEQAQAGIFKNFRRITVAGVAGEEAFALLKEKRLQDRATALVAKKRGVPMTTLRHEESGFGAILKTDYLPAKGTWSGEKGNSIWYPPDGPLRQFTEGRGIPFINRHPDFSRWSLGKVDVPGMTGNHSSDFRLTDKILGEKFGFTVEQMKQWRTTNFLTYHHLPNGTQMEVVSRKIHRKTPHGGGASILKIKNQNP